VPYKGGGPAVADLLGGQVQLMFATAPTVLEHVRAGKLRALGIADRQRLPTMPDVPTLAEAGVPIEGLGWNGIFVPAGTPPAIIDRLQAEITKVLRLKDMQDEAATLGTIAGGERPQEFAAFVRSEVQKWGKVIKDAGIKAE
jgi:tripartite-type tricarboxylate transporter receptor subunit TctC